MRLLAHKGQQLLILFYITEGVYILAIALIDQMNQRFCVVQPIIAVTAWIIFGDIGLGQQWIELILLGKGLPIGGKLLKLANIVHLALFPAVEQRVLTFEMAIRQSIGNSVDPLGKVGKATVGWHGKEVVMK